MSNKSLNSLPLPQISADDGLIAESFQQLDLKLSAWVSAVSEAHSALLKTACDAASPEVAAEQPANDVAGPRVETEPSPTFNPPAGQDTRLEDQRPEAPDPLEALEDHAQQSLRPDSAGPVVDDDERLLQTLEPERRAEVRVRRRMYSGQKSIREVIAELEAEDDDSSAARTRRSWWRIRS